MAEHTPVSERSWVERYAVFTMSDGSPSFRERQRYSESLEAFVQRARHIEATGGGYVVLSSWQIHRVSRDEEAQALAAHYGEQEGAS